MAEPLRWRLLRFVECIEDWIERDHPPPSVRLIVVDWAHGRDFDPREGMTEQVEIPNLWFGQVPGTQLGGRVVTCSYWVFPTTRIVRCNQIVTLRLCG